jgi:pantetheine-phosphate adenylyltransferase
VGLEVKTISPSSRRRAIYPGSFDPVTNGHLDVIRRARKLFPDLVVGVAVNPGKGTLFSVAERVALLKDAVGKLPGVRVIPFDGLVVHFARLEKACVIVRGLRMLSDFEYEFQMALTNRKLEPGLETIFMMTSEEYSYLSSRLLKEVAALGADLKRFVPPLAARRLKEKAAVG